MLLSTDASTSANHPITKRILVTMIVFFFTSSALLFAYYGINITLKNEQLRIENTKNIYYNIANYA
jgi:hypothetical protein